MVLILYFQLSQPQVVAAVAVVLVELDLFLAVQVAQAAVILSMQQVHRQMAQPIKAIVVVQVLMQLPRMAQAVAVVQVQSAGAVRTS
jgi:hypothetical protein